MKTVCLLVLLLINLHGFSQKKKKQVPIKPVPVIAVVNQDSIYSAFTTEKNLAEFYRNMVFDTIQKTLSIPLTDTLAELKWQKAFIAMERIQYKSPWVSNRLHEAATSLLHTSFSFQQSFLELMYAMYPLEFNLQVKSVLENTEDAKSFCIAAEYLLKDSNNDRTKDYIQSVYDGKTRSDNFTALVKPLFEKMNAGPLPLPPIQKLLRASFYNAVTVVFSIQRKNRNYPGMVIVRQPNGQFYRNADNSIFHMPQLARTVTNLPYYLNNGNPPQGIYKIKAIDTTYNDLYSGPTASIELAMPYEIKVAEFSPLIKNPDFPWHIAYYRPLLPVDWQEYQPIFESFNTGNRHHQRVLVQGSAVNPDYYKGKPWYPLCPSLGGITNMEKWNKTDGRRMESDQLRLVSILKKIAGAYAYYVIVELNDNQEPVSFDELKPSIPVSYTHLTLPTILRV